MNLDIIIHAGLATGTILLFAAIGEIFAERSGVMNLGGRRDDAAGSHGRF